jgi:predicted RNA methylase
VVEIGAGLGALTTALAERGAERVLAVEFDRALVPALRSVAARASVNEPRPAPTSTTRSPGPAPAVAAIARARLGSIRKC